MRTFVRMAGFGSSRTQEDALREECRSLLWSACLRWGVDGGGISEADEGESELESEMSDWDLAYAH